MPFTTVLQKYNFFLNTFFILKEKKRKKNTTFATSNKFNLEIIN